VDRKLLLAIRESTSPATVARHNTQKAMAEEEKPPVKMRSKLNNVKLGSAFRDSLAQTLARGPQAPKLSIRARVAEEPPTIDVEEEAIATQADGGLLVGATKGRANLGSVIRRPSTRHGRKAAAAKTTGMEDDVTCSAGGAVSLLDISILEESHQDTVESSRKAISLPRDNFHTVHLNTTELSVAENSTHSDSKSSLDAMLVSPPKLDSTAESSSSSVNGTDVLAKDGEMEAVENSTEDTNENSSRRKKFLHKYLCSICIIL
jgi:hypothetical protein